MAKNAPALHALRINRFLEDNYQGVEGVTKNGKYHDRSTIMTRRMAAHVLRKTTDIPDSQLRKYITDGPDDRGIDAVYYSRSMHKLVIVQAKWTESGTGTALTERDASEFVNGIRELLSLEIRDTGNEKLQAIADDIDAAIMDFELTCQIILVALTKNRLADRPAKRISKIVKEIDDSGKVAFEYWDRAGLYSTISNAEVSEGCDFELEISNCGAIADPYNGYFGYVSGLRLAELTKSAGPELFAKNLRGGLGGTSINQEIRKTALETPDLFWYFNNGITIIAENAKHGLVGGLGSESRTFKVTKGSVVNGAQTTSSLAAILDESKSAEDGDGLKEVLKRVKVHVRLIELPDEGAEFASNITRFNNSQNSIGYKDFVSLDPFQKKLQRDIDAEFAIPYYVRSGTGQEKSADKGTYESKSIDLQDATVALVCVGESITNAVRAKDKISSLWRNTEAAPYTEIFDQSKVTAKSLVKSVRLLWGVESFLESFRAEERESGSKKGKKYQISQHGNRLFSYYVMSGSGPFDEKESVEEYLERCVEGGFSSYFEDFCDSVLELYPESIVSYLFKNQTKSTEIISDLPAVYECE